MAISVVPPTSSSSGSASNDFTINVGTSGYTNVTLSTEFPAGNYICTSSLSDTTLDIYLISSDGTVSGYSNAATSSTTVAASNAFNRVVIYGAASNDTLTFQFKYVFAPTNITTNYAAGPKVTSISTSSLPNINDTTTVTGENFATDVSVSFIGSGYSSTLAKSVVRNSSTSLTVTRPDSFPVPSSPFTMIVTNPGTAQPSSTNVNRISVTSGAVPVWQTSAALPSYKSGVSYSQQVIATDVDGSSNITYSIVSGTLPTGITFNTANSTFSGTSTATSPTSYSYTIRATDSGNNTADRTFLINALPAIDYIVLAGGAGGGGAGHNGGGGGGGGAGGYLTGTSYTGINSGTTYTLTIGAGGAYGTGYSGEGASVGSNGANTTFGSLFTAVGGGGGSVALSSNGIAGGSGGGSGGYTPTPTSGGAGTSGQGNNGGGQTGGNYRGGSGGGKGSAGIAGGNTPCTGGTGITGFNGVVYAGGGGGTPYGGTSAGDAPNFYGGSGVGGNGSANSAATSGVAGRGSGGGGGSTAGYNSNRGGSGSGGVIVIRYPDTYPNAASATVSPTTGDGYKTYTFSSNGSITF
jgi:hypothetical protein